jgi:hypothetical protein
MMSDKAPRKLDSEILETNDPFDVESDSESAGQAGDTQGLSDIEEADSESVEELTEEGQGLEADLIDAIGGTRTGSRPHRCYRERA